MPELPEVECARRLVAATCCGRVIEDVVVVEQGGGPRDGSVDDIVLGVGGGAALRAALIGRTLEESQRKGKVQLWRLSGAGESVTIHFGMTGAFSVRGIAPARFQRYAVDTASWPPRFCKLEVCFVGGVRLALTDPRRLARVTRVVGDPMTAPPLSALAPDAWLALPALDALAAQLAQRSTATKALLLDQTKVLSGVGNWVADEVLYQARIHPETLASALSATDVTALRAALVHVLDTACAVDADASRFPADWLFAHRWGKGKGKAALPDGSPINFVTVGGRTSAVVLKRQGAPKKKRRAGDEEGAGAGGGGGGGGGGAAGGGAAGRDADREADGGAAAKKRRKT